MPFALPPLPALEALPALRRALAGPAGAAVFAAPPGSGKTTLAPLALLDEPWLAGRSILLLEPRRVAARAAAWRMSDLSGRPPGDLVGWHVRLERKASRATRVLVLTEGLLARRLLSDPELSGVGLVIFDEFHERGLQADFSLALALDVRRGLRPDLRLLAMSATLDSDRVAGRIASALGLPSVPVVRAEGRLFPVETEFLPFPQEPRTAEKTALGVRRALAERDGSVLAFLPGEGEIRACADALSRPGALPPDTDLRPLFAALPRAEQDAALRPSPPGRRKVVLATSIAESSLTIEGVVSVVDSGWARVSRFSPDTGMSHLETVRVSRDRADQRAGRAGRLGPGVCYRLWDEGTDRRLAPAAAPEILGADLADVVLACADWGVSGPDGLPWPTPPPDAAWRQASALLRDLRALGPDGRLTPLGRDMCALGVHPRLARMLLAARASGPAAVREAALLAAALSETIPASARPSVNAEHLVRDLEEGGGAVPPALRSRVRALAARLESSVPSATPAAPAAAAPVSTGALLALAWPDRVARRRPLARDEGRYRLVGGRGARLPPGDGLARYDWIVVADIDDADADGAVRLAAPIAAAEVERLFGDRFSTAPVLAWNARRERVDAVLRTSLGAVAVREAPLPSPDPEAVLSRLCEGVRAAGIGRLGWTDAARALQARVAFVRRAVPDAGFPDFSDEALASSIPAWLGPRLFGLSSLEQAARVDLAAALRDALGPLAARLDALAPERLAVATGSRVRIDYSGDAPVAEVRLQECFGMTATPRVAGGAVPVLLRLLSPAQRPVQTTSDLATFWREGYPLVRKELRGRYPRHFWPDDPLHAAPTRRAKPRG